MASDARTKRQDGDTPESGKWLLKLYIAGQSSRSLAALQNLKRICEEHLAG
jgi:circadian clock protein KaiB